VVVEWDAREMGAAARGRGERERGRKTSFFFLSTNLKFEAFLDGRRSSLDQDRPVKGIIVCIPCLQGHDRGMLPFSQELLETREKKKD
jgi:hypothetical protein